MLVRPHPQNAAQWVGVDLGDPNSVVWPPGGQQPDAGEARAGYFDSLAHSACIVGINTSGLIEAGIVGKAVLTVARPRLRRHPGRARCTSTTCAGRTAGCSTSRATSTSTCSSSERALQQGEEDARQVRRLRPALHAAVRARPARGTARRAGNRGARPARRRRPPADRSRHPRPPRRPLPGRADDDRRLVHARRRAACAEDGARGAGVRPANADRPPRVRPPVDPRRRRAADRRDAGGDPRRRRTRRRRPLARRGRLRGPVLDPVPALALRGARNPHRRRHRRLPGRRGALVRGPGGALRGRLRPHHRRGFPPADARALGADRRPPEAGRGALLGRAGARRHRSARPGATVRSSTRSSSTACSATSGRRALPVRDFLDRAVHRPWSSPNTTTRAPRGVHRRPFLLPRLVPRHARRTASSSTTSSSGSPRGGRSSC